MGIGEGVVYLKHQNQNIMKLTPEQHQKVKPLAEIVLKHIANDGIVSDYNGMCYTAELYLTKSDTRYFTRILHLYHDSETFWFPRNGSSGLNKRKAFLQALIENKDIEIYNDGYSHQVIIK